MNNKNKELAKRFLDVNKISEKAWLLTDHITDQHGQVAAFSFFPHNLLLARGHIVIASTEEEGERIFKEAYPNDDWNMAEIEEFEGKIIIWD